MPMPEALTGIVTWAKGHPVLATGVGLGACILGYVGSKYLKANTQQAQGIDTGLLEDAAGEGGMGGEDLVPILPVDVILPSGLILPEYGDGGDGAGLSQPVQPWYTFFVKPFDLGAGVSKAGAGILKAGPSAPGTSGLPTFDKLSGGAATYDNPPTGISTYDNPPTTRIPVYNNPLVKPPTKVVAGGSK